MTVIPLITKEQYNKFLVKYKKATYQGAPASDEAYVKWWNAAMYRDLKEGSFKIHFKPFQKDGPLHVLDKTGSLPEKYVKKLGAYPAFGKELGLDVTITVNDVTKIVDDKVVSDGKICEVKVSGR